MGWLVSHESKESTLTPGFRDFVDESTPFPRSRLLNDSFWKLKNIAFLPFWNSKIVIDNYKYFQKCSIMFKMLSPVQRIKGLTIFVKILLCKIFCFCFPTGNLSHSLRSHIGESWQFLMKMKHKKYLKIGISSFQWSSRGSVDCLKNISCTIWETLLH